jgi:hypothetical protein
MSMGDRCEYCLPQQRVPCGPSSHSSSRTSSCDLGMCGLKMGTVLNPPRGQDGCRRVSPSVMQGACPLLLGGSSILLETGDGSDDSIYRIRSGLTATISRNGKPGAFSRSVIPVLAEREYVWFCLPASPIFLWWSASFRCTLTFCRFCRLNHTGARLA